MVLDAWNAYVKRTDDLVDNLTDEQLMREVAPGRNRGIYLLGHLAAVHDRMLPILGFGDPINSNLYKIFVEQPDGAVAEVPPLRELRIYWNEVNKKLAGHFNSLSPED